MRGPGEREGKALLGRNRGLADAEPLAGEAEQDGAAEAVEKRQGAQDLQVLAAALAEVNGRPAGA